MVQRNLASMLKQIETDLQDVRDVFLTNLAEDLVNSSLPTVDTGAYITSHSITTTRGAGRSRTSRNRPTGQNANAMAQESMSQLMGDIASIPTDQTTVYITNNAPHASAVEYGGANWVRQPNGYKVYESVRNRADIHLQAAVNEVKARR